MEQYIEFKARDRTIRGILHIPEHPKAGPKAAYPGIVLCHGFTGNKIGLHRLFVKAARFFSRAGFAVLRFDFSGCGDSDGGHEEITIDGQVREASAALDFLKSRPEIKRDEVFLIGLSMGGAVAALTAPWVRDLAGLVLWAPVANMYEDIRGIVGLELFDEVLAKGVADFGGFALGRPFVESLRNHFPLAAVRDYKGPMLILHGTGDKEISPGNLQLYQQARNPIDSTAARLIPGADHTFSGLNWEEEIFNTTAGWLKQQQRGESYVQKKNYWSVSSLGINVGHPGI